ncbi:hypothetical protein C2S51_026816 [Perilla frutescens var. frutescens]|nr:hypothetical protein C2S51_026816 [Perilla frutescens var. frutescens]
MSSLAPALSLSFIWFAMALSWDELSADHKIVFLLESLANEQHQQSPIACRVCDKIFLDNTSLLEHFLSHFNQDGTLKGRQHVESSVRNSVAHGNTEPCAWGSVSPNMPNLSLGHGTLAAQPHPSSNFHARFASHTAGLHPRHPIRPGPDFFTPDTNKQSNFGFRPSDPGTSGLARGTGRCHPQTARRNTAEGHCSGYTRPYIKQLERPIQQTIVVLDDVGGNNKPDEMDLTLKL